MSSISAPVCKICSVAHWSRDPHVFGGVALKREGAAIPFDPNEARAKKIKAAEKERRQKLAAKKKKSKKKKP